MQKKDSTCYGCTCVASFHHRFLSPARDVRLTNEHLIACLEALQLFIDPHASELGDNIQPFIF